MSTMNHLVEACRGHDWYMVVTPHRTYTAVSVALLNLTEQTQFLATGDSLDASLDALWDDVRSWAKERAATGSGRTGRMVKGP